MAFEEESKIADSEFSGVDFSDLDELFTLDLETELDDIDSIPLPVDQPETEKPSSTKSETKPETTKKVPILALAAGGVAVSALVVIAGFTKHIAKA
jgi:hypothetical protein